MKSSGKQTKIPFSERKLRTRSKNVTPRKSETSDNENSPLKYKLVVRSESKIILRRSSTGNSKKSVPDSSATPVICAYSLRSTPKRGRNKSEDDGSDGYPTPSKLRFRSENLDNVKNADTPSTMLAGLKIDSSKKSASCESPKSDKVFKPRQLFPNTNASSARKALYSSSKSLPCREEEIEKLFSLLEKYLKEQSCGSIYVAGLPGTGKTASVEHVVQSEKIRKGYNIVKINCTSVSSSVSIYKRICSELKIKMAGKLEKDPKVLIESYLLKKHKMILLILDEIDQLETRSQSVLYKIFEWPSWKKARLVLIGIANAMDLTDRLLPRLCAKVELKPVLLHFRPYSKDQIQRILGHRLSEVELMDFTWKWMLRMEMNRLTVLHPSPRQCDDVTVAVASPGMMRMKVAEREELKEEEQINALNTFRKISSCANQNLSHQLIQCSERFRGADDIFSPSAIELISAKVAGMSGDVRRALDLGRRVVEISEEAKTANLKYNEKSPVKKIDSNEINTDTLTDFIKINDCRRSPRKSSIRERSSGNVTNLGNFAEENKTPVKNSEVPFLFSDGKKSVPSKKSLFTDESGVEEILTKIKCENSTVKSSVKEIHIRRESPRKLSIEKEKAGFSVDSKDVFNVVKNIYGSSKTLKSINEDSSFPLHQKILICTFLLISNKGKTKDLNVGKLHQVYTKICTKRGITPVDLSGFLFLCRQVEMTGIMQIGKGPGKLAKITLQWDETEVKDALKDLNLLSSIMEDVSCL